MNGSGTAVNRALEHIAADTTGRISVQSLAEIAGVTPHHFSALFCRATGLTPHQFLLRERIERAKVYLQDGVRTIRDISHLTGFRTQEHFTKVFRRMTGETPAQFRKQAE